LFIKEREESPSYKLYTTKHYGTTLKHILDFQEYKKKILEYDDINQAFFEEFFAYLSKEKELTINSAGGIIKDLRTFMYYSLEHELTNNAGFIKGFKVSKKESQGIALNERDLHKIETVELEEDHLKRVRDLFLIQTYSGIRYSDLANLKPENFDLENGYITIYQIKTEDKIMIPIHTRLKRVLDKYPEKKIPVISNQKYNQHIKEVCRKAEINEPIQQVWYYGKKRVEEIKPKHDLISTHSARRSFITLSLQKGGLPEEIMAVSGHRDRKSFDKYVKIAKREAIEKVKSLWEE
jgi:integrase